MRIAFRADAAPHIGLGHVARCLTLADAMAAAGAETRFVCRAPAPSTTAWLEGKGHKVAALPAPAPGDPAEAEEPAGTGDHRSWLGVSWTRDARETKAALGDAPYDLLVADHYGIDARWEKEVAPRARRLLVIDDMADRPHICDCLLDQNLRDDGADPYKAWIPAASLRLMGPRYALLRPEFRRLRPAGRRACRKPGRILVCLGGSDPTHECGKILEGLATLRRPDLHVTVVAGALNRHYEALEAFRRSFAGFELHRHTDAMADLMAASDLAIGAGGSSTWERCCLGLPTLAVVLADNQEQPARAVAALGAQITLGRSTALKPADYARAVDGLTENALQHMSDAGMDLVDGDGCGRVLRALEIR